MTKPRLLLAFAVLTFIGCAFFTQAASSAQTETLCANIFASGEKAPPAAATAALPQIFGSIYIREGMREQWLQWLRTTPPEILVLAGLKTSNGLGIFKLSPDKYSEFLRSTATPTGQKREFDLAKFIFSLRAPIIARVRLYLAKPVEEAPAIDPRDEGLGKISRALARAIIQASSDLPGPRRSQLESFVRDRLLAEEPRSFLELARIWGLSEMSKFNADGVARTQNAIDRSFEIRAGREVDAFTQMLFERARAILKQDGPDAG
jgi:hypothetical protein